ncbi:MAG: alpha-amylase domain-containing protein, partial [Halanaerobiales bacterium]
QAYTYIMTREKGTPMLYWKDFYISGMREGLEKILIARRDYAYGPGYEVDNNDSDVYSYVRAGLEEVPGTGLVMMITGGDDGRVITKEINSQQPGQRFFDLTGNVSGIVETDSNGTGRFRVINSADKGWSIWVPLQED